MLNFLLLTRDTHRSGWLGHRALEPAIKENWSVDSYHSWKDTELLDDGFGPHNIDGYHRLTRYCNKSELQEPAGPTTVLLYAPPRLHLELARLKRPNWFYYHYYDLEDPIKFGWLQQLNPKLHSFRDFELLPTAKERLELVRDAFLEHDPHRVEETDRQLFALLEQTNVFTDQMSVDSAALFGKTDFAFNLVDVVQSNYQCVAEEMGLPYSNDVKYHTMDWLVKHPVRIKQYFEEELCYQKETATAIF